MQPQELEQLAEEVVSIYYGRTPPTLESESAVQHWHEHRTRLVQLAKNATRPTMSRSQATAAAVTAISPYIPETV